VESALHLERGDATRGERFARDAISHARSAGARGYELLAMATRAEALARAGRLDDARRLARDVSASIDGRRDLERAERIHLRLATALSLASDDTLSAHARAQARAVVDARLEHIRSDALRHRYLESRLVRSIRSGAE
jgi:hypothetical protein